MKISSTIIVFVLIFSMVSAIPKLCKYRGRQLTKGQIITDCFASVTCYANGEIKIKDPCPMYTCTKLSMRRGYKRFDPKKPYPDCCGGPICEDGQISFYGSITRSAGECPANKSCIISLAYILLSAILAVYGRGFYECGKYP